MRITKEWITTALEAADNERSKISEREKDIFGLSSIRLRAFLNNVCSIQDVNYLEIGVYKGATVLSTAFGNPKCTITGIENFSYDEREPKKRAPEGSIWSNVKSHLYDNIKRYDYSDSEVNVKNISIIEEDVNKVAVDKIPTFNVCFYDKSPVTKEDYTHFFNVIFSKASLRSILIFSNYSNEKIADMLDEVLLEQAGKFDIMSKFQRVSSGLSDGTQYYSGILVLEVQKKVTKG